MHATRTGVARLVLMTTALSLSLVTPVAAKEPVDPGTLNPPPPAEFNPVCERLGGGIVCDLAFSDPPVIDEPGGLVCDGDQIFESWTRSVVGRRIYDSDGNLLKRQFQEDFVGSFTNPSSGATIDFVTHATNIHVLSVPGDVASGISSGDSDAIQPRSISSARCSCICRPTWSINCTASSQAAAAR